MPNQQIKLEIVGDKVKVTSPYNANFVAKCRNFRGTFKKAEGAWYFDDSILDYVREAMIEFYGTTGEEDYATCILLITGFNSTEMHGAVTLFGRTIAKAWGRDSGARLGDDIVFISGSYDSGGSVKNWCTSINNATFEIHNFPLPGTELPEVQKAINEGWCTIKQKPSKTEIRKLAWNAPELFAAIGPYAMNRKVLKDMDSNITTTEGMIWFLKYEGKELKAFCAMELTKSSASIKYCYSADGNIAHKYDICNNIIAEFKDSELPKLYAYFRTSELNDAKEMGFKPTTPGKNWHKMLIEK